MLLSTGPASAYQGSTLGVYSVIPDEPGIYEQKGGDYYMYKDKDTWYISSRLTNCNKSHTLGCVATWVASIKTEDLIAVGEAWSYGKDKGWGTDDTTLQFVPVSSPLAACIACTQVLVISDTNPKTDSFGVFTAIPGKYSAGRPVYENSAGLYLMIKNEYTSFGIWADADKRLHAGKGDGGVRFARSGSAPTCVTDLYSEAGRAGHGWQVVTSEEWVDAEAVRVVCLDSADA